MARQTEENPLGVQNNTRRRFNDHRVTHTTTRPATELQSSNVVAVSSQEGLNVCDKYG